MVKIHSALERALRLCRESEPRRLSRRLVGSGKAGTFRWVCNIRTTYVYCNHVT